MDCNSASDADRVCDCGEGVQWPNDRKPIFFILFSKFRAKAATPRSVHSSISRGDSYVEMIFLHDAFDNARTSTHQIFAGTGGSDG
jgi:hypothetical protein